MTCVPYSLFPVDQRRGIRIWDWILLAVPCGPQPCHRGILKVLQMDSRKWFQHVSTRMKTSVNWDHHPKVALKIKILKPARKVLMEKTDHSPISAHLFQPLLWPSVTASFLSAGVSFPITSYQGLRSLLPWPRHCSFELWEWCDNQYSIFCIYNYIILQYIYMYITI
jgi:hypothetical protein